jgi:hypothetical protein
MDQMNNQNSEINRAPHLTLMSWKAIFAGFLITIFTSLALTFLGIGMGGIALSDLQGMEAFGWGATLWVIATVAIALFVGSYVASRISNFVSRPIGIVQGATIAALFFSISVWGGGIFLGSLASTAASVTRGVAQLPAGDFFQSAYQNPQVRAVVDQEIRDLGIAPSQVSDILSAVVPRILMGDNEGAENIITSRTSIDPQLAKQKAQNLLAVVEQRIRSAAEQTASSVAKAGLSLFFMFLLGGFAAMFGGAMGSRMNSRNNLAEAELLRAA